MPAWLEASLPIVGPLGVAALTAALGIVFAQPRRIRRDLAEDAAILPSLSGVARGLLSEDMHHNAIRLAAWRRYPGLLPWDYFRLLLVTGGVALQIYTAWAISKDTPSQPDVMDPVAYALPAVVVAGAFYSFHQSWVWRSRDRRAMLEQHYVPIDPDTAWFWSNHGVSTSVLLGVLAISGPPSATAIVASRTKDWPTWTAVVIALAATALFALVLMVLTRAEENRPITQAERQQLEMDGIVEGQLRADLGRQRKRELGLRWYQRLPADAPVETVERPAEEGDG